MTGPQPDREQGSEPSSGAPVDATPARARILVWAVIVVIAIPGLLGLEFWPVTGWKLFSTVRDEDANRWVLQGHYADDASRIIDLGELPVAYSNAEWPLRSVGDGGTDDAHEKCRVLLEAAVEADPDIVGLDIARDSQRLVPDGDEWAVSHDLDVRETCTLEDL